MSKLYLFKIHVMFTCLYSGKIFMCLLFDKLCKFTMQIFLQSICVSRSRHFHTVKVKFFNLYIMVLKWNQHFLKVFQSKGWRGKIIKMKIKFVLSLVVSTSSIYTWTSYALWRFFGEKPWEFKLVNKLWNKYSFG